MKIAVTGSSGFVGRALVARIRMAGMSAVPVTRRVKSFDILESDTCCGDYLDVSRLACLFEGCDVVIHLAARAHIISNKADNKEKRKQALDLAARDERNYLGSQAGCEELI